MSQTDLTGGAITALAHSTRRVGLQLTGRCIAARVSAVLHHHTADSLVDSFMN